MKKKVARRKEGGVNRGGERIASGKKYKGREGGKKGESEKVTKRKGVSPGRKEFQ